MLGSRIIASNLEAIAFEFTTLLRLQREHATSIEDHLIHEDVNLKTPDALRNYLMGVMTAESDIAHIIITDKDHRGIMAYRNLAAREPIFAPLTGNESTSLKRVIDEGHARAGSMHLSRPWFDPITGQTVISLSRVVSEATSSIEYIEVAVSIQPLSERVNAMSGATGNIVFALLGGEFILAHPILAKSPVGLSVDVPLPSRDELGDGVLDVLESAIPSSLIEKIFLKEAELKNVTFNDVTYMISQMKLKQTLGGEDVIIGTYRRTDEVRTFLQSFYNAFWLGGAILLISLGASIILARSISRPIQRISDAASEVGHIGFDQIKRLPGSFIRELDEMSSSFNSMIGGLKRFERYVPRSLVTKLIERGDDHMTSEERVVSVMFTDIAGFTSLSEGLSATEVADFTNEHLTLLGGCVDEEYGTIDKYIGDSLMAFWGAPDDMDDHASAACRAALAIKQKLAEDNVAREKRGLKPVRIRIGIHTGPLIVGDIGSPSRINYTIMGDTVNVAARLEALGKEVDPKAECLVLVSGDTVKSTENGFNFSEEGAHTVRGKSEATSVFRLQSDET
ncbi:MAG: adenylate/guanylate cyclase domain-containing protein [Hyphomicrobiales bacterium]